jgi:hypothetical protein
MGRDTSTALPHYPHQAAPTMLYFLVNFLSGF